jgi:hypothetical protein
VVKAEETHTKTCPQRFAQLHPFRYTELAA